MDKKTIFKILEIEETKDEQIIKRAYRTKLTSVNPEDDPEGFKMLREAFEEATRLSKEKEESVEENTPVKLWIEEVYKIYGKRSSRMNKMLWKSLFEHEVCKDFETEKEAREAFLVFLMDNFRLPADIWALIEEEFDLVESKQELYENFPPNFIDFITDTPENKSWIDFNLFEGNDDGELDVFISNYLDLRHIIDYREYEKYEDIIAKLDSMDIWHPYLEVEKIRFNLFTEKLEVALDLADKLKLKNYEDLYVVYYIALAHLDNKKIEEAFEETKYILEQNPNHFGAKYILASCYCEMEEYDRSKTLYMELLELDSYNETIISGFQKVNEKVKDTYQKALDKNQKDKEARLELGWCLLQENLCQECVDLVEGMEIDEETRYNYYNLIARAYVYLENYDKAYDYILHWRDEITSLEDDGSEKIQKRIKRLSMANYLLSKCHNSFSKSRENSKEEIEKCIEYLDKAIETEENEREILRYMLEKAEAYLKLEDNTKCIDVCDQIIERNSGYYPAYVFRQEAYYNLRMAQEVIDDFYRATDIYAGEAKPYIFAIKAFMGYSQYEDAQRIFNRAKEAEVESNELMYNELVLKGYTTEGYDELKSLSEELKLFYEKVSEEAGDIKEPAEVLHQLALCYYNMKDFDLALKTVNEKLEISFSSGSWVLYADCLEALEEYEDAAAEYKKLTEKYTDYVYGYYQLGSCYIQLDEEDMALEAFEKVIEFDEEHRFVHNEIKDIYKNRYRRDNNIENYNIAVKHALRQVELFPDVYYYNELGLLYLTGYELEKAVEAFAEALKHKEDDMYSHNNMGFAYKIMGEFEKAHDCYQLALKHQTNDDLIASGNLATYYRIKRQFKKSEEIYKEMLTRSKNPINILEDLYSLYLNMRAWDEAIAICAEKHGIQNTKKTSLFSSVKKLFGKKDRFLSDVEHNEDYMEYLCDRGEIGIYKEDYEEAEAYYKEAVRLFPDNAKPYKDLGDYYLHILGDAKKALEYYDKGYKSHDEDFDYRYKDQFLEASALAYSALGDTKKTEKYIKDLLNYNIGYYGSIEDWLNNMSYRKIRLFKIASWKLLVGDRQEAEKYQDLMLKSYFCRTCDYAKCVEYLVLEGMFMELDGKYKEALAKYEEAINITEDDIYIIGKIKSVKKKLEEMK